MAETGGLVSYKIVGELETWDTARVVPFPLARSSQGGGPTLVNPEGFVATFESLNPVSRPTSAKVAIAWSVWVAAIGVHAVAWFALLIESLRLHGMLLFVEAYLLITAILCFAHWAPGTLAMAGSKPRLRRWMMLVQWTIMIGGGIVPLILVPILRLRQTAP